MGQGREQGERGWNGWDDNEMRGPNAPEKKKKTQTRMTATGLGTFTSWIGCGPSGRGRGRQADLTAPPGSKGQISLPPGEQLQLCLFREALLASPGLSDLSPSRVPTLTSCLQAPFLARSPSASPSVSPSLGFPPTSGVLGGLPSTLGSHELRMQ